MYNNFQGYQNQNYQPNQQFCYQQNPYQNQQYQQQYIPNDVLGGKIVDSIDVVRAINADLSGKANYYPKSDGSEIYCKRINPQTGASGIQTYILRQEVDNNVSNNQVCNEQISTMLTSLKQDLFGEISSLKDLFIESMANQKGGK